MSVFPSPLLFNVTGSRLHRNAMPRTVEYMLWIRSASLCVRSLQDGCMRGVRTLERHTYWEVFRSLGVLSFEGINAVVLDLVLLRVGSCEMGPSCFPSVLLLCSAITRHSH